MTVDQLYDKGIGKGLIVYSSRELFDNASDKRIAVVRDSAVLRGDGGSGGLQSSAPRPHAIPDRQPDRTIRLATQANQALIYRLSGDYNPLHIDPAVARSGGFDRPILHGLATYGVAGRALLDALCGNQGSRMRRLDVRFTRPVYCGETLELSIWLEQPGRAGFRARVMERDALVLDNGLFLYAPQGSEL